MCDASFFSFVSLLSAAFFFFFACLSSLPASHAQAGSTASGSSPRQRGAILHPRRLLPARMVDGTARGTSTSPAGRLRSLSSAIRSLVRQSIVFHGLSDVATCGGACPTVSATPRSRRDPPDQGSPGRPRRRRADHSIPAGDHHRGATPFPPPPWLKEGGRGSRPPPVGPIVAPVAALLATLATVAPMCGHPAVPWGAAVVVAATALSPTPLQECMSAKYRTYMAGHIRCPSWRESRPRFLHRERERWRWWRARSRYLRSKLYPTRLPAPPPAMHPTQRPNTLVSVSDLIPRRGGLLLVATPTNSPTPSPAHLHAASRCCGEKKQRRVESPPPTSFHTS